MDVKRTTETAWHQTTATNKLPLEGGMDNKESGEPEIVYKPFGGQRNNRPQPSPKAAIADSLFVPLFRVPSKLHPQTHLLYNYVGSSDTKCSKTVTL